MEENGVKKAASHKRYEKRLKDEVISTSLGENYSG